MRKAKQSKPILIAMGLIGTIGFFDALYLTIKHYSNALPSCSIFTGCEVVTTSPYSEFFGIPVALFGTLYYGSVILGVVILLNKKIPLLQKALSLYTITGLLASVWFVSLQLFVINAICPYCMVSAASSTALFVCGVLLSKRT